jgi:glyoxylase-like metal-dependent hydrolase (beta-lactamase superfamily II)
MPIHTLDLNFQGISKTIACYAIPHAHGVTLIDPGPGSTLENLQSALQRMGLSLDAVTDVLLTHIHLDHAGASGALATRGALIHCHANGAAHLINPEKLLKSAQRIYGDKMDSLWGQFLPVPEDRLTVVPDREEISIGGQRFTALDTPGHADHHLAYIYEDTCFTGDVGGVRLPGFAHLRVPMPPPEFHIEKWRASLDKLRGERFARIAPTHFGIFEDRETHLSLLSRELDHVEEFLERVMPADPPVEDLNRQFLEWTQKRAEADGLTPDDNLAYETANPSWMSAVGMQRYWKKNRMANS